MIGRSWITATCLPIAAAAGFAACGGSEAEPVLSGAESKPNTVQISGGEYAYVMPDRMQGGVITMEFSNEGKEFHEYSLGRITDESKTVEDVKALFSGSEEQASQEEPDWIQDVAGVPLLSPGQAIAITRTLEPGRYVFVCPLPAPDGRLHSDHGMVRMFEVEGRSGDELPAPDAVVTATGDGFDVPKLEPGRQTIELRNGAPDERGFILFSPEAGKTLEDIGKWGESGFKGPAPATFLGAMQSIPPGTSAFLTLELEAGKPYVFLDEQNETAFTVSD